MQLTFSTLWRTPKRRHCEQVGKGFGMFWLFHSVLLDCLGTSWILSHGCIIKWQTKWDELLMSGPGVKQPGLPRRLKEYYDIYYVLI